MNGRQSRGNRREWSFAVWARRSGERVCRLSHRDLTGVCPACGATT